MISENFDYIYKQFRIEVYRHIFAVLGERDSSLSAADYFSVETIYLLGVPTMKEFAKTLHISQPNATYRVKMLEEKGYVARCEDGKHTRLTVTDKFKKYYHETMGYGNFIFEQLSKRLSAEELAAVDQIFEHFIEQIEREKTC